MKHFDYENLATREWDREVVNYIGLIHEYRGRQQLYLKQMSEELNRLIELAKIQSTEASNEIEGIRTTEARLKGLMKDKTSPKNRNEEEILGYRYALNLVHEYYQEMPVNSNYILQLHKEMYQFQPHTFGGKFKDAPNEISAFYLDGHKEVIFQPLEPYETPDAVRLLCDEYNKAIHEYQIDPLLVIPVFVHDFLCIHPFNDGNGRMSRLLTTLLLYKEGYSVGKYISIEKKIQATKDEYYNSLSLSSEGWIDNKNDNTPFIKYLLGIILAAYRDFENRVDVVGEMQTSKDIVVNAINQKFGPFTKSDIADFCPRIGRSTIENTLKALCEEDFIEKCGGGRSTYYIRKN